MGRRESTKPKIRYTEAAIQKALWSDRPFLAQPQFEMIGLFIYQWESDYLAISRNGYVYEAEIKISHADFLNEAKHKAEKMRILASCDEPPCNRPNYFYYVCPRGVISLSEVPNFAGLIEIDDRGFFETIKPAPVLHNHKHSFSAEYLRDKYYWASWNWIQRYWNKGVKDISASTARAYEKSLGDAYERISELECQIHNLKAHNNERQDNQKERP